MSHSVQKFNQNDQPFQEHSTFSGKYYLVWSQANLIRIQNYYILNITRKKKNFSLRGLTTSVVDGTGDSPRLENAKASQQCQL